MCSAITKKVMNVIDARSAIFAERTSFDLKTLTLRTLLKARSPLWFLSQRRGSADELASNLIETRLQDADENFASSLMEELAVFVFQEAPGERQPTMAPILACDIRAYSHRDEQSLWHLLSGECQLYFNVIVKLGDVARTRNASIDAERSRVSNRMTRELLNECCTPSYALDWRKLADFASR